MRITRSRTKRPRGALLQLDIDSGLSMRRIGGRLRSLVRGPEGATGEIPLLLSLDSNPSPLSGRRTVSGG
jgi:hypothetical protein